MAVFHEAFPKGEHVRISRGQTFGEFATFHPHWHTIVLEGGFDSHDRFFFIPIGASDALQEL